MRLSNVNGNKNLSNGDKCALALVRKVGVALALEVKASCELNLVEGRLLVKSIGWYLVRKKYGYEADCSV